MCLRTWMLVALAAAIWGCDRPAEQGEGRGDGQPAQQAMQAGRAAMGGGVTAIGPAEWSRNWPQFRGPGGDGVAPEGASPPETIDLDRHVRWRTPLEAPGHGTPIVWEDRIYLTAEGGRILAFDRATGAPAWDVALDVPAAAPQPDWEPGQAGLAAPSACTDGQRVFAFFGDGVLGCVDRDGRQVWAHRVVAWPRNVYGLAAGPVYAAGLVVQVVDLTPREAGDDLEHRSFIAAWRAEDGREAWRTPRETDGAWATPVIAEQDGRLIVVTCAREGVIAYDLVDGHEVWRARGLSGDVASSPVARDGRVYAASDPSGPVLAIRLGGRGDVTDTHVAWARKPAMPDTVSPLVDGERYVHISFGGSLVCLDAAKGEVKYQLDNDVGWIGHFVASPVEADGRIYAIDDEGVLYVVRAEDGEILSVAELDERVSASPAVAGDCLYLRTRESLLCIGPEAAGPQP